MSVWQLLINAVKPWANLYVNSVNSSGNENLKLNSTGNGSVAINNASGAGITVYSDGSIGLGTSFVELLTGSEVVFNTDSFLNLTSNAKIQVGSHGNIVLPAPPTCTLNASGLSGSFSWNGAWTAAAGTEYIITAVYTVGRPYMVAANISGLTATGTGQLLITRCNQLSDRFAIHLFNPTANALNITNIKVDYTIL